MEKVLFTLKNGKNMSKQKVGIWLIGARGGVATTAILGLCGLKRGLVDATGTISGQPPFANMEPLEWDSFVVGGHEIRDIRLVAEAERLASERAIDAGLVSQCTADLEQIDRRIRPGTVFGVGPTIEGLADPSVPRNETPRESIGRLQNDLRDFADSQRLEHVIVVNVSSTEPAVDPEGIVPAWPELEKLLETADGCPLPASSLYAIAALDLGYSYINFTPSLGSAPKAVDELARLRTSRHMGCDGKTGETLMKSVLAPLFALRNLEVMSWVGHNIFGNMDGRVLDDPVNKKAKVTSKDHLLADILGYRPQTHVSIEFIESLGDWKTAWDHIHFKGFLGTPMTLQFTWQGCDSLLAAPLVLDLVRFTEIAKRRGQVGRMDFLASFFKSPYGLEEQGFVRQFQMLEAWARGN